jgi:hypothetical protein
MRTEYLLEPEEKIKRWGPGIWTDEPDEAEWVHEETGLPCMVLRNLELGTLCGYVGVHETHPWHGKPYDDPDVSVHGGLTFCGLYGDTGITSVKPADALSAERTSTLSAKPDASYVGHWFFGFDCGHAGDLMPQLRTLIESRAREPLFIASRMPRTVDDPAWSEGLSGAERVRWLKKLADPMAYFLIDVYRDFVWVRQEVEELARQAGAAAPRRT